MSHHPIAYTYEADTHCPDCTETRFGRCNCGFIACTGDGPDCGYPNRPNGWHPTDSEGNEPGVIAPWDEWTHGERGAETFVCGTCSTEIDTAACAYCGSDDCTGNCED